MSLLCHYRAACCIPPLVRRSDDAKGGVGVGAFAVKRRSRSAEEMSHPPRAKSRAALPIKGRDGVRRGATTSMRAPCRDAFRVRGERGMARRKAQNPYGSCFAARGRLPARQSRRLRHRPAGAASHPASRRLMIAPLSGRGVGIISEVREAGISRASIPARGGMERVAALRKNVSLPV